LCFCFFFVATIAFSVLLASSAVPGWTVPLITAAMGVGRPSRDLPVRRAATQGIGQAAFGRVYGFVSSGQAVGIALVALLFGPLLDAGYYSMAFYGIAQLQFLAVATALMVGTSSRRDALAAV